MRRALIIVFGLVMLLLSPFNAGAEGPEEKDRCVSAGRKRRSENPYGCFEQASRLVRNNSYPALSKILKNLIGQHRGADPLYLVEVAELMKGAGDPRAEYYYKKAIESDQGEPAFELFFADYLRNYRGPLKPLFPRAEAHYFEALRKLERKETEYKPDWDDETARRVERGLVALYQEDGIPIRTHDHISDWITYPERPLLFVSSINKSARDTGDFDNIDDVRAFTSEALLAAQRRIENGSPPLTRDDFRNIARVKPQYETLDRLRFRYKGLPAFEFYYRNRNIEHGAITEFQFPDQTNGVRIDGEYGAAMEKPFSLPSGFDFFVRGAYSRIDRTGLIEFVPQGHEIINQYSATLAASRFVGPDKAILQAVYVYQDINPSLDKQFITKRDRQIASGKFTYDLLRKFRTARSLDDRPGRATDKQAQNERLFELRGWNFFGGVAHDDERFGPVILRKRDYFSGTEIKGIRSGLLDLGYQATIFTSEVTGNTIGASVPLTVVTSNASDSSIELGDLIRRQSIQLRHNATVLIRIKDEEREPAVPRDAGWLHPAFIQVVFPFKYDTALDRHREFENYRIGLQADAKLYGTGFKGTSFLVSAGYSRQVFFHLGKALNLATASFSVGF